MFVQFVMLCVTKKKIYQYSVFNIPCTHKRDTGDIISVWHCNSRSTPGYSSRQMVNRKDKFTSQPNQT